MAFSDVITTPGAYYAIAYWLSGLLYITHRKKRLHKGAQVCVSMLFLVIIFSYLHFNSDVPPALFVPSMSLCILLIFGFMYLSTESSLINAGYYTVRAFILGEFAASFEWQIYFFSVHNNLLPDTMLTNLMFLVVSHSIVFAIMYYIEKTYKQEYEHLEISGRELSYTIVIGALIFAFSNLSYILQNTPFSGSATTEIFNIRTLVDFSGLVLLSAYHIQLTEHHMKFEVEKLHSLLTMQNANFRIAEKSVNLVNQKYHDLKHQISAIRAGIESGKSLEYLDQLEHEIKVYEAQNKTGNKILDILLTGFQLQCHDKHINLTCVAEGAALDFMDDIDISTLFGNILDNAVDAVKHINSVEQRLIHLTIQKQKGFLRIRSENCYEGVMNFAHGLPVTTKSDKSQHGFGLKSIRNIVQKYSGSMTIHTDNGWFELRILIPLR